jgi:surface antigen
MRTRILPLIIALPLGACAVLKGGDPEVYSRLNDQDVALAARLMQQTLENAPDGDTRRWNNQTTGSAGTITPVRTYVTEDGDICRDYREEISLTGQSERFFHTACRSGDARWVWL